MKQQIVVLGAGPAGMSAAWRLSQLGYPVTVLEKDTAVGGMGKTITVGRYTVDYGPHTFHIRETEESRAIHEAIKPLFGEDPLILTRGTRVLLRDRNTSTPLEMLQAHGRQPTSVGADYFRLPDGHDQVNVRACEERALVRRVGVRISRRTL
jgi:protoporphyrinogen oxidase